MRMQVLLGTALVGILLVGSAEARDTKKGQVPPRHHAEPAYEKPAAAKGGQNMAGCGLGSLAVQDNGKWSQVAAAFLNGTGMQTFGISFGTSNCTEDGVASAAREKDAFVEANLAELRHDLAVGNGEYLSSLASFYGCKGDATNAFSRALRKHQDKVSGSTPEQASRVIDSVVSEEHASCLQS